MNCSNGHANPQGAQFCSACGATLGQQLPPPSFQLQPQQPVKRPAAWWPITRWGKAQGIIVAVVAFSTLYVIGALLPDDGKAKSEGIELCAALRDPENRLLDKGDFMQLTDMEDYEIERYVLARCPDQFDRVD